MLLHEKLTETILQACFEVSNELGPGFLESVYEKALLISLQERGLQARAQVPIAVRYHGQVIGEYFANILVEDKVIIELKTVSMLLKEHQAQVIHYLKATGIDVGLLVNFKRPRVEHRRLYRPTS